MPDVVIRDIDEQTLDKLRDRAQRNGRSLEGELHNILERAAVVDLVQARALAAAIREELTGRTHSDSTGLVADDRRR